MSLQGGRGKNELDWYLAQGLDCRTDRCVASGLQILKVLQHVPF